MQAPPLALEGVTQNATGRTTRGEIGSGLSIEWEAGFASSPGVLLADELVFGVTTECFAELTAAGR